MRLYSGSSEQFIDDVYNNKIADKLKNNFLEQFHYNPSQSEVNSWQNSLRSVSMIFDRVKLNDHGVILEYRLPQTSKRLDCLVCGKDAQKRDQAVIMELKQWQTTRPSDGEHELKTILNGGFRDVLHPSVQVGQYKEYLQNYHTAFYEGRSPILLNACSYLHNYPYNPEDEIYSVKFEPFISNFPVFTKDEVKELGDYLVEKLSGGDGMKVLSRVEGGKFRPSKKLLDHIAGIINGSDEYTLLDEQLVAFDMVINEVEKSFKNGKKTTIIIEGGPGTGKSVIAMNLMGKLSGRHYNTHYVTGSRAFTGTLNKILGNKSSLQLMHFNKYGKTERDAVDVVIADEAHRMWPKNLDRFTRKEDRVDTPIVDQIINAAKVPVFFVDNLQVIRPNEVGTVQYIEEHANQMKSNVLKFKLQAQFRCQGSDAFVSWIDNTLGIEKTADVIWSGNDSFDFRIFESPESLERAIMEKSESGKKARIVAGFCWEWSDPMENGQLVPDVSIGDFKRPWNAKSGVSSRRLGEGIPKETLWAHDPNGIHQIGCVYTAQGFEFDYVGVIFGLDLKYNLDGQKWEAHPENSKDPATARSKERFITYVKNIYRILFSRGMEGCYVYFVDKDTERFFKTRME